MVEQFQETRFAESAEDLHRLQPQFIQIADTGAADSENVALHGLNRIPRGVRIVNCALGSADECVWYRLATDEPWTNRFLYLRFRCANARVLLEVF